jgi:hypothetical protein
MTRSALHIAVYFFSYEDSSPQALCISLFYFFSYEDRHNKRSAYCCLLLLLRGLVTTR